MDTRPTRLTSHGRTIANGLALVTALVALNASLTFENVWPTPRITWGHTLSPELVALVILLTLAPRLSGRLARWLLPTVWTCLVIGRYIDVTGPGLYGRDFNLYWDSRYLGDVVAMLGHDIPWWLAITGLAAGGLVVGIVFVAGRLAVRQVALAMDRPGLRLGLGVTAAIAAGAYGLTATPSPAPAHRVFAAPVTSAYVRQARFVTAMLGASAVGPQLAASPDFQASLGGLGGRDVIVLFAESYGAVAWDTPGVAAQLAASQRALAEAVHDTDRQVVSAYVESPTFGGSSWLAHLTLLSGVEVRDQYAYTALMASSRDTLVRLFGRRGYRTVALMPGMRQAWPEGAFYGFDTIYGRSDMGYRGPQFGWWSIPDQFSLARLDTLERSRTDRRPVFAVFPTSTTHAPFGPVAPYQPVWPRILDRAPFEQADVDRAMKVVPDIGNLRPSYVRATAYEFTVLAGWLRAQLDDAVLVIVGDHQPAAAVTGPGAPWTVPVHVITRHAPLLDRLRVHGFADGLAPHAPAIGHMDALVPILLDAFSTTADGPRAPTATR